MAFIGVQVDTLPNSSLSAKNGLCTISGLSIAAFVGAPDPTGAAADSGVFVSGVPAVNQNALPANFGPGAGHWDAAWLQALEAQVVNPDPASLVLGSSVELAIKTLVGSDIVLTFHNRGAGVSPAMSIDISVD